MAYKLIILLSILIFLSGYCNVFWRTQEQK